MNKFDPKFPYYDDDSDYNTNANSYYKDLGRKTKLIKLLAKRIWEYDERLDNRLQELEIVLNDYLSQWDERIENLDDEVSHIFVTWLEDGTLEQIINDDVLGNKADKTFVDDELEKKSDKTFVNEEFEKTKEQLVKNKFIVNSEMTQSEINDILENYNTVEFENGVYEVDLLPHGFKFKSNQTIYFNNVTVKTKQSNLTNYRILDFGVRENIRVHGTVRVIGNRETNTSTSGSHGHGIYLFQTNNIRFDHVEVLNCWGDGVYVGAGRNGFCENVHFNYLLADNNRRQGVSVISVKGLTADYMELKNTNGADPQAGIDFEPNESNQFIEGVHIRQLKTTNNSRGVLCDIRDIAHIDIIIDNFIGDDGVSIFGRTSYKQTGAIVFNEPNITKSNFQVRNKRADSFRVIVNNPTLSNGKYSSDSNEQVGSAFGIFSVENDTPQHETIGGVYIYNPKIIGEQGYVYPLYVQTSGETKIDNIHFINPIDLSGAFSTALRIWPVQDLIGNNVRLIDPMQSTKGFSSFDTNIQRNALRSEYVIDEATGERTFTLRFTPYQHKIVVKNLSSHWLDLAGVVRGTTGQSELLRLAPNSLIKIESLGDGTYIRLSHSGQIQSEGDVIS